MKTNNLLLLGLISLLALATPTKAQTFPRRSKQESLKILSWNIYMLPYLSWFNHNGRRASVIGRQLMDSDFQIIVFQEAFNMKCRRIIHKILAAKYPYQYGPANASLWPFRTSSGLWILSKIPLTKLKAIKFKEAKGFDKIARKGAVLFEGCYDGTSFQLLATHLQSDNPQNIRNAQYKEISDLLSIYYTNDVPQILCGDFNTEMSNPKAYTAMLKTLDAQNGELSGNLKVTYDEAHNTLAKNAEGKQEIIDYILTRNTSLIANMQRKVLEFYHSDSHYKTHLSDHYAMEATVEFAPSPVVPFMAGR